MTKKDYIAIAEVINKQVKYSKFDFERQPRLKQQLEDIAKDLVDVFTTDNIRFDKLRFFEACGL
jgi:hypothetical protein